MNFFQQIMWVLWMNEFCECLPCELSFHTHSCNLPTLTGPALYSLLWRGWLTCTEHLARVEDLSQSLFDCGGTSKQCMWDNILLYNQWDWGHLLYTCQIPRTHIFIHSLRLLQNLSQCLKHNCILLFSVSVYISKALPQLFNFTYLPKPFSQRLSQHRLGYAMVNNKFQISMA